MQSYVYGAKREIAEAAEALGRSEQADKLRRESEALKRRFHEAFWCPEILLVRDSPGRRETTVSGAKLECRPQFVYGDPFRGTCPPDCPGITVREIFFRLGVRTIATTEVRYNPMSYHNGSVWPHDNALVAHGLAQSVEKTLAAEILTGLFDASIFLELHRLPELFCGFPKRFHITGQLVQSSFSTYLNSLESTRVVVSSQAKRLTVLL